MLAFMFIMGAVSLGLMIYNPRAGSSAPVDDPKSAEALTAAKNGLIGYAVRRGGATGLARPLELPCPDTNNDGWEEANCAAGTIGRIPWRTLGIPAPTDSAGEILWYAVSGPLRTQPSNATDVNSNTRGDLVVRAADGATVLTSEAAAVVFAPGQALGNQNRDAVQVAICATTGGNIARNVCAANYLETSNATNNAATNGPFVAGVPTNTYNDRVLYFTVNDYLPAVEMRVGSELRNLLLAYRQNSLCQCFPWAESWSYSDGDADNGVNRGRFPSRPYPENWGEGAIPLLPQWVAANDWHNLTYYSAARTETDGGGLACIYCSPSALLSVNGAPVSALLFTPGPPPAGIDRASAVPLAAPPRNNMPFYLDDPQNNDKGTCPGWDTENANGVGIPPLLGVPASCDTYVTPTSTAVNRDRLFMVTLPACALSATTLVQEALLNPCSAGGGAIRAACQTAADALATCTCSPAAQTMITPPCRNTLNPGQCQAAVTQLIGCF
ncbi:MAG TPA: hypothetical protein VGO08_03580 [Burkholderiales bacterium]|jgi:hypothetical protein|nr:hypothetical protein [Burkholderiales bacterium]